MDLRRSEWIPDRVIFSLIELPADIGRWGYMDCVPINIGCCWGSARPLLSPVDTRFQCVLPWCHHHFFSRGLHLQLALLKTFSNILGFLFIVVMNLTQRIIGSAHVSYWASDEVHSHNFEKTASRVGHHGTYLALSKCAKISASAEKPSRFEKRGLRFHRQSKNC